MVKTLTDLLTEHHYLPCHPPLSTAERLKRIANTLYYRDTREAQWLNDLADELTTIACKDATSYCKDNLQEQLHLKD
jgi:hypothetical protein